MESSANETVSSGVLIIIGLVMIALSIGLWLFGCYCCKRICEKCGHNPGILIWIPILNLIPLLHVAGMATWMIILLIIPIVGFVVAIMMWIKICEARGKSPALVLGIALLPIVFLPYLAFSE